MIQRGTTILGNPQINYFESVIGYIAIEHGHRHVVHYFTFLKTGAFP